MSPRLKNFLWVIVVIIAFTIFTSVRGDTGMNLNFGEDALDVLGPEGFSFSIEYDEIKNVTLLDPIETGTQISGNKNRRFQWGLFENELLGQYTLCISKKIDNAVLISMQDGSLYAFNFESEETTEALIKLFNDLLAERKAG